MVILLPRLEEPISQACKHDNVDLVKQLLAASDWDKRTLKRTMYHAIASNAIRTLDLTLANMNSKDGIGAECYFFRNAFTPTSVQIFAKHGITLKAPRAGKGLSTRIQTACDTDDVAYMKRIFHNERIRTRPSYLGQDLTMPEIIGIALRQAILADAQDVLRFVIESGADLNVFTPSGGPEQVSLASLQVLHEYAYDLNKPPGMLSRAVNDIDKVKYCLDHGASLCNDNGKLLEKVAVYGTPDIFELLLSRGAVLSTSVLHQAAGEHSANYGQSPAAAAKRRKRTMNMLRYLLYDLKMDPNTVECYDVVRRGRRYFSIHRTPIHCCFKARGENLEVVRFLLESGADPFVEDNFGSCALDRAKACENHEFVALVAEIMPDRVAGVTKELSEA